MVSYEDIQVFVGGFGRYQLFFFIWCQIAMMVFAANMGYMTFARLPSDPDCRNETDNTGRSNFTFASALPSYDNADVPTRSKCTQDQFWSVAMEWDLTGPRSYIMALIFSAQMGGLLVGTIFWGQLADWLGRKPVFLISFMAVTAISYLSSFGNMWELFMVARSLIGFFMGGALNAVLVWMTESLLPKHRLALLLGSWPLGYLFTGLVAKFTLHWKFMLLWMNAPAAIVIPAAVFTYESPKWKLEKGRTVEAANILYAIGRTNRINEAQKKCLTDTLAEFSAGDHRKRKVPGLHYWHLFYNRDLATRMMLIISLKVVTAFSYYAILFNLGDLTEDVAMKVIYLAAVRCALQTVLVILDQTFAWFSRRLLILGSTAFTAIAFGYLAIAFYCKLDLTNPLSITIASLAAVAVLGFQFGSLATVTSELMPTLLRSMGLSLASSVSRAGAILAPQIFLLFPLFPPAPFILIGSLAAACFLLALFLLPETKNKPLPDLPDNFLTAAFGEQLRQNLIVAA